MDTIDIRGARTHNLKNISLTLPRNKLIVITGLSGSGKSSLAFDTLYAEGQRRYVESLSVYARQFLSLMEKPDVDKIDGLSPAIAIEQKSTSRNPRSTVGTITEVYDYLRLLFARVGEPRCPTHQAILVGKTVSQMVDQVLSLREGIRMMMLAPVVVRRKGGHSKTLATLTAQGFIHVRINGKVFDLSNPPALEPRRKHTLEVVVDRFRIRSGLQQRLAESFETALQLSGGNVTVIPIDDPGQEEITLSSNFSCVYCGYSMKKLEPSLMSFNSPAGACPDCDGLGIQQYFDPDKVIQNPTCSLANGAIPGWTKSNHCHFKKLKALAESYSFDMYQPFNRLSKKIQTVILSGSSDQPDGSLTSDKGKSHLFEGILPNLERRYRETESSSVREELARYISNKRCIGCNGTRLREEARNIYICDSSLPEIAELSISDLLIFFSNLKWEGQKSQIAEKITKEISNRLHFLANVGLHYLSLSRGADTLSGGETQRIRLASQIGSGLVGVMYVLDEPSIGLHQRDNERLLETLTYLRDLGNTVIVVEHDEDSIRAADYVVDIGPGAGTNGGSVVATGNPSTLVENSNSLTSQYLNGKKKIDVPLKRTPYNPNKVVELIGASGNNLKNVNLVVPIGLFTCITGVSGSGKSTLINDTFFSISHLHLNGISSRAPAAPYKKIKGLSLLDRVIEVSQSPIGRTPRSNPATYTGVLGPIRELFSGTREARLRGYQPGRFSFNLRGGRCEVCQGHGVIKVEMHFLPDVYVPCDACKGERYNRETLEIRYKGKAINEVLSMTVEDARSFFDAVPTIARKLQTLLDVGLSYIRLGQPATILSGGEAQRVKLAKELSKRDTGKTLYVLDEPTTGLHFDDIKQLLAVLNQLRNQGNTIIVIEHNLDVIKTADWIIDLGPEGGQYGGEIVAQGKPEDLVKVTNSHTARFLRPKLGLSPL